MVPTASPGGRLCTREGTPTPTPDPSLLILCHLHTTSHFLNPPLPPTCVSQQHTVSVEDGIGWN